MPSQRADGHVGLSLAYFMLTEAGLAILGYALLRG